MPSKSDQINSEDSLQFISSGRSMLPTFKPGQLLYIKPGISDVREGDILVFQQEGQAEHVAHRVQAVLPTGFITQGDNNRFKDPIPVPPSAVVGRVEGVRLKDGNIRPVWGGNRGVIWSKLLQLLQLLVVWIKRLFGGPYRLMRKSGVVKRYWHPKIQKMSFQSEYGVFYKFIFHKRVIATWIPSENWFECKKPFDLILSRPEKK